MNIDCPMCEPLYTHPAQQERSEADFAAEYERGRKAGLTQAYDAALAQQERKPSFIQERAQLEQEWCELRNLKREAQQERKPDDNARLLAAAPDLLDALRSLVDEYEPNMKAFSYNAPRKQLWDNACAAIAKATYDAVQSVPDAQPKPPQ